MTIITYQAKAILRFDNQPQLDMETKSDDKAVGTMLPTHLAVEE
ncbi:hypothetical protein [Bifidobacterium adolescentis]|nr:hypothetical protein [Bifidobacterium adolescentis]